MILYHFSILLQKDISVILFSQRIYKRMHLQVSSFTSGANFDEFF